MKEKTKPTTKILAGLLLLFLFIAGGPIMLDNNAQVFGYYLFQIGLFALGLYFLVSGLEGWYWALTSEQDTAKETNTKPSSRQRRRESLWPTIIDTETAKKASRYGFFASMWVLGLSILYNVVLLSVVSETESGPIGFYWLVDTGLVDTGISAVIGWRIYRHSRFAAVAGLCLYLWVVLVDGPNAVIAVLVSLAFVNGVRGTFAMHSFLQGDKATLTERTK